METIFISYARETHDGARQLADDCQSLGRNVWFDEELSGGIVWWDRILESIRACDVFLFALSGEALESVACKREYAYAVALRRAVLPVLLGEGVVVALLPESLAKTHFVDYRSFDKEALKALSRALTKLPAAPPLPVPLPDSPPPPVSYLGALAEQVEASYPLSFEVQTAVLLRLKQSIAEPADSQHAATLLKKFLARDDLYARVAAEASTYRLYRHALATSYSAVPQGEVPLPPKHSPIPSSLQPADFPSSSQFSPRSHVDAKSTDSWAEDWIGSQPPVRITPTVNRPRPPDLSRLEMGGAKDVFERCSELLGDAGYRVAVSRWGGWTVKEPHGAKVRLQTIRDLVAYTRDKRAAR